MQEPEIHFDLLARLHGRRHRVEVELIIANIERRGVDQIHAAARALARHVHRVVAVHRTHPGRFFVGRGNVCRKFLAKCPDVEKMPAEGLPRAARKKSFAS